MGVCRTVRGIRIEVNECLCKRIPGTGGPNVPKLLMNRLNDRDRRDSEPNTGRGTPRRWGARHGGRMEWGRDSAEKREYNMDVNARLLELKCRQWRTKRARIAKEQTKKTRGMQCNSVDKNGPNWCILQALWVLGRRQVSGHRYIVLVDSKTVISRVRADALDSGQRMAIARLDIGDRFLACVNEVTICCVSAHSKVAGNKQADSNATMAAGRTASCKEDGVLEVRLTEASLPHTSHSATEARSRAMAERIASHVRPERRFRPSPGCGLPHLHLRNSRKESHEKYNKSNPVMDLSGRASRE